MQESTQEATEHSQYLTFRVAGQTHGIAVLDVREILPFQGATRVPLAPPAIRGLINLRGTAVPVLDLAVEFGLATTEITKRSCVVILDPGSQGQGGEMGILSEEVEVVLPLGPEDICIGRLSEINARPQRGAFGMAVSPFVFRLDREVSFTPNYEVAEVVWVPLAFLLDTDNRQQMSWNYKGAEFPMPCYFYQERRIWGLSLMMLDELLDLVEGRSSKRKPWVRR